MSRRAGAPPATTEPLLIAAQITGLQALHYLLLGLIAPPLLAAFADPMSLSLEGGAWNVAMVLDWRELAGRSALEEHVGALSHLPSGLGRHPSAGHMDGGGGGGGAGATLAGRLARKGQAYGRDGARAYVLGLSWLLACAIECARPASSTCGYAHRCPHLRSIVYLFYVVRRPTHVLDFCLTLVGIHLILAAYYASSMPTSLYFWLVLGVGAVGQIVWAEQLCIRRESTLR